MNNPNFQNELRAIRNENDFNTFMNRNRDNPVVQRMLQMTSGKNNNEIMGIANNLAGANKIDLNAFKKYLGF